MCRHYSAIWQSKYKHSEILYLKTDSEYIICKLQYCIIYTQHAVNIIDEERKWTYFLQWNKIWMDLNDFWKIRKDMILNEITLYTQSVGGSWGAEYGIM